jgi:hypothetical protein
MYIIHNDTPEPKMFNPKRSIGHIYDNQWMVGCLLWQILLKCKHYSMGPFRLLSLPETENRSYEYINMIWDFDGGEDSQY